MRQDSSKVTIDDQFEVPYALLIGAKINYLGMTLKDYYALCFTDMHNDVAYLYSFTFNLLLGSE